MTLKKDFEVIFLWKFSFLKFYVMGATGIDFGGIAHVKVGVIAHQKIYLGVLVDNTTADR